MLLDRKRINRWAKWVALFLAVIFAAGFLFMGVGYGGAGFNLSSIFTGGKSTTAASTPEEKIAAYQAALAKNDKDVQSLIGLATVYQQEDQPLMAAAYLEQAIKIDPAQKDLYLRLANLYMSSSSPNYSAAVGVLNKATTLDPNNPDIYLQLGVAQNRLGNTEAAILAWQKYLALAPNGDQASVIKKQLDTMAAEATTTTTTAGATSTTAAGTATTAAGDTATTAAATATGGETTTTAGTATTTPTTAAGATTPAS